MQRREAKTKPETEKKPAAKRTWRGRRIEPEIDPAEIERLRDLIGREEMLERDLRRDMEEVVRGRDKRLGRELRQMEERNKRLVMWIGVSFLMLVIVICWVMSLRAMTSDTVKESADLKNFDLAGAKDNLTNNMKDIIADIERIKAEGERLNTAASSSATATSPFPKSN